MKALSDELRVTPPVITGIVDRLEEKGLVKRTRTSQDRRTTEIALKESGKSEYRKIQAGYRSSIHESLQRSLLPVEQETLAKLLKRFVRAIPVQ